MSPRPRAYGQGIITRPQKPKQSLTKRIAAPLAAAGIIGGGIIAGIAYIAATLVMLLLALAPYILCLAAAAWLITQLL